MKTEALSSNQLYSAKQTDLMSHPAHGGVVRIYIYIYVCVCVCVCVCALGITHLFPHYELAHLPYIAVVTNTRAD